MSDPTALPSGADNINCFTYFVVFVVDFPPLSWYPCCFTRFPLETYGKKYVNQLVFETLLHTCIFCSSAHTRQTTALSISTPDLFPPMPAAYLINVSNCEVQWEEIQPAVLLCRPTSTHSSKLCRKTKRCQAGDVAHRHASQLSVNINVKFHLWVNKGIEKVSFCRLSGRSGKRHV